MRWLQYLSPSEDVTSASKFRHPRESGGPGETANLSSLDARSRGHDNEGNEMFESVKMFELVNMLVQHAER